MKRFIAIILSIVMIFLLVACGSNDTSDNSSNTQAPQESTTSDTIIETKPTGDETNDTPPIISNNTENGTQGSDKNHVHTYKKSVIAPTCEKDGFTSYFCDCGARYAEDTIMAKGHSFNAWKEKKAATQTSVGKEERKCKNCDKTETRDIPKLIAGHTHKYTASVTRKATCQSEGVKTFACSCGAKYTESIGVTPHNYKTEVVKPTCTAAGYTKYTCNCGKTYYDNTVKPTSHKYTETKTPATCTTKGYTTHTCKLCGGSYTDSYVDGGHNYVNGKCSTCGGKDPAYAVSYKLNNGVLTIYGKGPMDDYNGLVNCSPWYNQRESIVEIIVEDGITHVGKEAFISCTNVEKVTLKGQITSIGQSAFLSCEKLEQITLPESITIISDMAFCHCKKLNTVNIPNSVTHIGNHAFGFTRVSSIKLSNKLVSIGESAFFMAPISSILLPNTITQIKESAFALTDLTDISIPSSIKTISDKMFHSCGRLKNVVIENGIKSIGYQSFYGCDITSITIPESVVDIDKYAFEHCTRLDTIYGKAGSYAEKFAKDSGYTFIAQ